MKSEKLSYLVHSNKLTQTLLHLNDKLTHKVIGIALPCESSVREVGEQGSHIPDQTGLQSETQFQKGETKKRKKHLFWLELIILFFASLILSFAIEKKKTTLVSILTIRKQEFLTTLQIAHWKGETEI